MTAKIEATDDYADYDPSALPAPVPAYLDAHDENRHADAVAAFAPGATVLDDGTTYDGIDAISAWVRRSATEYEYTSTRIGQRIVDGAHVVVRVRLDGSFPGGTVTLRYQFAHHAGLITRLAIEV
ncbi:nuclear transport factor 2 family protein [Nocardioides humi]|uniref:SnoaL-like domain-containing protein n=1 Tax=Nocardioides humi TaxID=449461 RepID=A0ABN2A4U4_9ACTN|nr:nuclear transport factor 2 family protein [Nocardioides humi]